jgi:uncharacterized surface protein with fasciclin (FAS1) repeats
MLLPHRYTIFIAFFLLTAFLTGCSKDDTPASTEPVNRNRIAYIIEDNFNFTTCRSMIEFTRQADRLRSDTVFTFLAPDNTAFMLQGISMVPYFSFSDDWFRIAAGNMLLPGAHSLRALPLGENQPLLTATGNNVYVSRYKSGSDTITRINGAKVAVADISAANGLIQSMMEVVQAETKKDLAGMLLSDTSLTLFTQALQHSGLMTMLKTGEYTLLAPHNSVLRSKGEVLPGIDLSSSLSILSTDPAALAILLKYHIIPGRYFLDGIHRAAIASGDASVATLHSAAITIGGNMDNYNSTTFLGSQNSVAAGIYRLYSAQNNFANFPAGNGVVHVINQVLIP